jgi:hypothetical protein
MWKYVQYCGEDGVALGERNIVCCFCLSRQSARGVVYYVFQDGGVDLRERAHNCRVVVELARAGVQEALLGPVEAPRSEPVAAQTGVRLKLAVHNDARGGRLERRRDLLTIATPNFRPPRDENVPWEFLLL